MTARLRAREEFNGSNGLRAIDCAVAGEGVERLFGHGVHCIGRRAQRLLFASTGTKDPQASDTLYIGGLAAPTQMRGFKFGTDSRLMLRPWRPGPDSALVAICTINVHRCQAGVLARYYPRAPGAAAANPIVGGCSIRMRPSLVTVRALARAAPGGLTHFAASIPSAKPKVATPNTAICLWSRAERSAVFASPTSRPRAATCRHLLTTPSAPRKAPRPKR